jgi:hypothetical protein
VFCETTGAALSPTGTSHAESRFADFSDACFTPFRMNTPTTSQPSARNMAAATDESTPPDIATSTRLAAG